MVILDGWCRDRVIFSLAAGEHAARGRGIQRVPPRPYKCAV